MAHHVDGAGHLNGLASIRGRLGWAFDRTLIYATGGVAFAPRAADAGTSLLGSSTGCVCYQTKTVTGGVVGGGIEWKYNPNLSFRLEGLHHYIFNEKCHASTTEIRTGSTMPR
jgi:outer membrane immunogenic protein